MALALGWTNVSSRTVEWNSSSVTPAGGIRPADGGAYLRLNPGNKFFTNQGIGAQFPQNPAIVIGHEFGHALIGIGSNTPSPYRIGTFDAGMEAANVTFVENPLREAFNASAVRVGRQESMRSVYEYGSGSFNVTNVLSDPKMAAYAADMRARVENFITDAKDKNECY